MNLPANLHAQSSATTTSGSNTSSRTARPTASPVLTALRAATHSRHAILDSQMPLAKPNPTLGDYHAHLQLLVAWLAPLEEWLATFRDGPQGPEAPPFIARTRVLLADLGQPEYHAPHITWQAKDSAAYRWGIGYVIEGSQLGGAMLYRRLAARLAPHPLGYLQDESAAPGRWPAFLHGMASQNTSPEQLADACAGATDAFDALLQLLAAGENNND